MKKILGAAILAMILAFPVNAQTLKVHQGSVTFLATGKPGFLKIAGKGPDVTGELSRSEKGLSGKFSVAMEKFTTGIDMRDQHMKEKYLEVAKFPVAVLTISDLPLKNGTSGQEQEFSGMLNLHGVEKKVEGRMTVEGEKEGLEIKAKFTMLNSDFGIEIPRFTGISMAEKVDVDVSLLAQP